MTTETQRSPRLYPWKDGTTVGAWEVLDLFDLKDISGYLVIALKKTGYRAYIVEVVSSYSPGWGHGGHCIHHVWRAVRCSATGNPLPPQATPEAMLALLVKEKGEDCLLPL